MFLITTTSKPSSGLNHQTNQYEECCVIIEKKIRKEYKFSSVIKYALNNH